MSSLVDRWAEAGLAAVERDTLRRRLEPLSSPVGAHVQLGAERFLNFSSNDYLGLAAHPRLIEAAANALHRHGVGTGASRLVVGDTLAHQSLERALERWAGCEAALLFNSGYAANVGVLTALLGPGDVVFSDALNHASLIDGCRLSRARVVVYPHRDVAALADLVAANHGRRRVVVTDTVFSMDGDVAPVRALRSLCDAEGLALVVDEAHATGVLGPAGRGWCAHEGVEPDLHIGTLSKALGSFGGFACGSRLTMDWVLQRARPLIFSTALPASVCAAAEAALELVQHGGLTAQLRARRLTLSRALGVDVPSAVVPVILGSAEQAVAASEALRRAGVLVKAIRPPTVPEGTSRLRVALTATHTDEDLLRLVELLRPWRAEVRGVAA